MKLFVLTIALVLSAVLMLMPVDSGFGQGETIKLETTDLSLNMKKAEVFKKLRRSGS